MLDTVDPSAISKLFCLAETEILPASDWRTISIGPLFFTCGPDLPVRHIFVDDEPALLIGWPVHTNNYDRYTSADVANIGGRWALVTENSITPDPLATYSIVYSSELKIAAASPVVIPQILLEENEDLNTVLGLPDSDNWYPFGLTPWSNLSRLLPNRILDLTRFTTTRCTSKKSASNDGASIRLVADNLKETVLSLAEQQDISILTTAGNDSRLLLAATHGAANVELVTFSTKTSSTDVQVAERLGLFTARAHSSITVDRDKAKESLWFEVVGRCVAGATLRSAAVKLSLDSERTYLKGIGGEIGRRTNYYRPGDETRRSITPEALVRRLHLPSHNKLHKAAHRWLEETTDYEDLAELIEIVYRENRIGAWAAPQLHGDSINSVWIFPINQQDTINALRFLTPEMKNSRLSPRLAIQHLWPELLTIPINPLSAKEKAVKFARRLKAHVVSAS